jgi:hypothetical protein
MLETVDEKVQVMDKETDSPQRFDDPPPDPPTTAKPKDPYNATECLTCQFCMTGTMLLEVS